MNKSGASRQSGLGQSGQGIVEYVLILVVVVTIAMIFMNVFAKPYMKWAQSHIGDYVQCLLDQGELPAIGGTSNLQDCDQPDFEKVATSASNAKSGSGQSDGAGANGKNGSSSSQKGGSSGRGTLVSEGGHKFQKLGAGGMDGGAGHKDIPMGPEEQKSANGYLKITGGHAPIRARDGKAVTGKFLQGILDMESAKIKRRSEKAQKVATLEGGEAGSRTAKKFAFEPHERKPAETDFSTDGWSFGKLFRILLIIVILIAIVLFIGGQLVQISKSMEK